MLDEEGTVVSSFFPKEKMTLLGGAPNDDGFGLSPGLVDPLPNGKVLG